MYPFESLRVDSPIELVSIFVSWVLVITLVAYGQHYLTHTRPWLARLSEGSYPFYILHQTIIVVIGYYVCKTHWNINAKFWTISLLTLAICVSFFELCIRPFNVMRFLFGLKLKRPGYSAGTRMLVLIIGIVSQFTSQVSECPDQRISITNMRLGSPQIDEPTHVI